MHTLLFSIHHTNPTYRKIYFVNKLFFKKTSKSAKLQIVYKKKRTSPFMKKKNPFFKQIAKKQEYLTTAKWYLLHFIFVFHHFLFFITHFFFMHFFFVHFRFHHYSIHIHSIAIFHHHSFSIFHFHFSIWINH